MVLHWFLIEKTGNHCRVQISEHDGSPDSDGTVATRSHRQKARRLLSISVLS
jgi:hypothetical protein